MGGCLTRTRREDLSQKESVGVQTGVALGLEFRRENLDRLDWKLRLMDDTERGMTALLRESLGRETALREILKEHGGCRRPRLPHPRRYGMRRIEEGYSCVETEGEGDVGRG